MILNSSSFDGGVCNSNFAFDVEGGAKSTRSVKGSSLLILESPLESCVNSGLLSSTNSNCFFCNCCGLFNGDGVFLTGEVTLSINAAVALVVLLLLLLVSLFPSPVSALEKFGNGELTSARLAVRMSSALKSTLPTKLFIAGYRGSCLCKI